MYIRNLQMLSIFLNFDWKSCKNLILSEKWKYFFMPLCLQGLYQLVLLIFFWICNFLKDLFLYLLCEICFGKKNSYNFIFLVVKVTAFVTLWQIQYKKSFFAVMPQYLHQYILWVNRPFYVRRKSPKKILENILKLFNCAMNLVMLWHHSVTTHLACQQTYPVEARGEGGGKTFC